MSETDGKRNLSLVFLFVTESSGEFIYVEFELHVYGELCCRWTDRVIW